MSNNIAYMESEPTEFQQVDMSQSTLNMLFWMVEESNSTNLELQGERLLDKLFGSLDAARQYRSEKEAQQFSLTHICTKNPRVLPEFQTA